MFHYEMLYELLLLTSISLCQNWLYYLHVSLKVAEPIDDLK